MRDAELEKRRNWLRHLWYSVRACKAHRRGRHPRRAAPAAGREGGQGVGDGGCASGSGCADRTDPRKTRKTRKGRKGRKLGKTRKARKLGKPGTKLRGLPKWVRQVSEILCGSVGTEGVAEISGSVGDILLRRSSPAPSEISAGGSERVPTPCAAWPTRPAGRATRILGREAGDAQARPGPEQATRRLRAG